MRTHAACMHIDMHVNKYNLGMLNTAPKIQYNHWLTNLPAANSKALQAKLKEDQWVYPQLRVPQGSPPKP